MRVIGYVIAALLAAVCAANAATDELSALYTQVLQRPADSETNLRYARAAEVAGKLRWAYAAYERVAINDPSNREAQEGLLRVARRLQPAFTEFLLQAGVSYESNPLYVPTNHTPEAQVFGTLGVKDERTFGDLRWRTTGLAAGIDHTRADQLNYAYAGATTGPVFDFIGGTQAASRCWRRRRLFRPASLVWRGRWARRDRGQCVRGGAKRGVSGRLSGLQ
jgi:hypothetical protein